MNTRIFKLSLLAIFCIGAVATNAQTKLSDEAVKVIKELKKVDTKGLSDEESATVINVLNQLKKQHSSQAADFVAVVAERGAAAKVAPKQTPKPENAKPANVPTVNLSDIKQVSNANTGKQAQSANVQVVTRGEMKPIRIKYFIDGREVPVQEYMNVMRTRPEAKTKSYRDKESLEKFKAQGYDMVWCMETKVNVEKNELPVISKFKQNGNQVSFRIEVPKSANQAKQKVDINYEL